MKRIKCNYHDLHVLKTGKPKLRKANISNYNREFVNYLSECILNVNINLCTCNTPKLRKHKTNLCKVAYKSVPLSAQIIFQRGAFLVPMLTATLPTF